MAVSNGTPAVMALCSETFSGPLADRTGKSAAARNTHKHCGESDMALANRSCDEQDRIGEALIKIMDNSFAQNGEEVHSCQSLRGFPASLKSVTRYA